MSARIDLYKNATTAYDGLLAVNRHLKQCSLPADLVELVFLRVSLINGCAYCIDKHSRDLLSSGMPVDKLVLVPVWQEARPLFTPREQAALAWAEALTLISETHAPDYLYAEATRHFSEKELVDLSMVIVSMNAWNRLAIGFHKEVPPRTS